jgi:hypothetical protein
MTPFQKQVFNFYKVAEQEEQQERMEDARGGGGSSGRQRNQLSSSGSSDDHSMSETVRYKSENDFSDEEDSNVAEFV